MTELQAKRIQELRMRGAGYRMIGEVLNLSRDSVRNYCKGHGLMGYGAAVRINIKEQIAAQVACQCCGKLLVQSGKGRKRKFCSEKCRREWWSAHQDAIQRKATAIYDGVCAYCGKSFTAYGNQHRKYCSHSCYIRARFGSPGDRAEVCEGVSGQQEETHERNAMADSAAGRAEARVV